MPLRNQAATVEPSGRVLRVGLAAMWGGSRAHPRAATVAMAVGLLNGLSMVLGARAVGWASDRFLAPSFAAGRLLPGAAVATVVVVFAVCALRVTTIIVRGVFTGRVLFGAEADDRRALADAYLRLGLPWHRRTPTGSSLTTAVLDVESAWHAMLFFPFSVGMVFMLVVALAEIAVVDLWLAATAFVVVPVVLVANVVHQRLVSRRAAWAQDRRAEVGRVANETFEGDQVVRTLGIADDQRAEFDAVSRQLRDANERSARVTAAFEPAVELAPTATVLLVLLVGTHRYTTGAVTVGGVVEVCYLLLTAAIPLNVIGRFLAMLPVSVVGRQRVDAVLAAGTSGSDVPAHGDTLSVRDPQQPRVTLEGVRLDGPHRPVLDDVRLELPSGGLVAVTGSTGAGKSTLLRLVARLLDADAGVVRHDGTDVRDLAAGQLPARVALATQVPFAFDDTVRANVLAEVDGGDDEQVWKALRAAAADEFVRALPDGLDTVVGEGGGRLSGGQRQRIALARALHRVLHSGADLLLLDDVTSALDPVVERQVLTALRAELPPGTTALLTVSRRAGAESADRVVHLDGGRVAAVGTHAQLVETHTGYRALIGAHDRARAFQDLESEFAS